MRRAAATMLVTLTVLVPKFVSAASSSGLTIEGLYGIAWPPSADFTSAVSGAADTDDFSEDSLQIAGGTLLFTLGVFELGAILDTTFGDGVTQSAIGGLAGFRFGDRLRLDLLGEVGGHRFGNITDDPSIVTESSADEWLAYVGLRPGIAYRFEAGEPGGFGLLLGVWGFARWDLTDASVPVSVGGVDGTTPGEVELGGTSVGLTLRAGFEL